MPFDLDAAPSIPLTAVMIWFACASVVLAVVDLRSHRLPDAWVLPGYPIAISGCLADAVQRPPPAAGHAMASAAFGAAILVCLYSAAAHVGAVGLGDVKLAGVLGILLGYAGQRALLVGVLTSLVVTGSVAAMVLVAEAPRWRTRSRTPRPGGVDVPHGPAMLAGAWLGLLVSS